MKRLIGIGLALLTILSTAFAQQDAKAKSILAEVSKKYKSYGMVKADFNYQISSRQAEDKETQTGTLITQPKNNKFKVILYSDDHQKVIQQEMISDGKTQWTFLANDNEVQVNDVDSEPEAMNPAQMFTLYEQGFKYLYTGDQKAGNNTYQLIDLSPTDTKKPFFKIRLMVDKVKKQLYSAEIFDKNGNIYKYTVKTFTPNLRLPETTFTFDSKKHPGIEIVDLR